MSAADLGAIILQMLRRHDGPCDFKVLVKKQCDSPHHSTPSIVVQPYMLEGKLHYELDDTTACTDGYKGLHVRMTFPYDAVSDIAVYLFDHQIIGDWFDLFIVKAAKEGQFYDDFGAVHSIIGIKTKDRDIDRVSAHLRMCARIKNIELSRHAPATEPQAPEDHGA